MGLLDETISPYEARLQALYPLIAESQKKEAALKAAALQPRQTTTSQAMGQALAALIPVLAGAAFGGSRGAGYGAQGGLVGLNAVNDLADKRAKDDQLSKLYLADSEKANRDLLTDESKNLSKEILGAKVSGARLETQDKLSRDRMIEQNNLARDRIAYAADLRGKNSNVPADPVAAKTLQELYYPGTSDSTPLTKDQFNQRATVAGLVDKNKGRDQRDTQERRLVDAQRIKAEDEVKQTFKDRTEPIRKEVSALKSLKTLLNQKGNTTDMAVKSALAKLRGETGAMTERDVESNVPASIASDAIAGINYFTGDTTSTITPKQRAAVKSYLDAKEKVLKSQLSSIRDSLPNEVGESSARVLGDQLPSFTRSLGGDLDSMLGGGTGSDIGSILQELNRRKNAGQ